MKLKITNEQEYLNALKEIDVLLLGGQYKDEMLNALSEVVADYEDANIDISPPAVDVVFGVVDELLADERYEELDQVISSIDFNKVSIDELVAYVIATKGYSEQLHFRKDFVQRVINTLSMEKSRQYAEKILEPFV